MGRHGSSSTRERGQEAVEFAIVLPLLVLIMFGVLDLGRIFHSAVVIANASREGARYGMIYPNDAAGVVAVTQAEALGSQIDLTDSATSSIAVTCPSGCGSGLPLRVTVSYRLTLIMGFVLPSPTVDVVRYVEMLVP